MRTLLSTRRVMRGCAWALSVTVKLLNMNKAKAEDKKLRQVAHF